MNIMYNIWLMWLTMWKLNGNEILIIVLNIIPIFHAIKNNNNNNINMNNRVLIEYKYLYVVL